MKKIFWGFLLLFLDINIGSVDILPGFVGYILICIGMGEVEGSPAFQRGRPWAIAGGILTAVFWLPLWGEGTVLTLATLAGTVIQLVVAYFITEGVGDLEQLHETELGYPRLRTLWRIMLVCIVVCEVMSLLQAVVFAVIALLVCAVVIILWLVALHRARKALTPTL